ncbi:MAG: hypothetical protein H7334_09105 [Ferruginibacter sp.]|nr:hypothetical protein [Ferruginibacter sp.]
MNLLHNHKRKLWLQAFVLLLAFTNNISLLKAQTNHVTAPAAIPALSRIEYYIDTDPGYGVATNVPFAAGTSVANQVINLNPASLTTGIHKLGIRSRDANGAWSLDNSWLFFKPVAGNTSVIPAGAVPALSRIEYYIDTDPGYGAATNVPFAAGTSVANQVINLNPASLTTGIHKLGIRSRDANGAWSLDNGWLFFKPVAGNTSIIPAGIVPALSRIEYYIDTDPGYGAATNVPFAAGTSVANQIVTLDPSTLTKGVHRFSIRSRDANGAWSLDNWWLFYKPYNGAINITPPNAIPVLTRVEYYIDTDPGYGNATGIAINAVTNLPDFSLPINVTGLTAGTHKLNIRSKDANNAWSLDNEWDFTVAATLASPAIITNSITKISGCANDSLTIAYDATGTYNTGNIFNAELSNAAGSFTTPSVIGTFSGTGNSIIKCRLPAHSTDGTNYKIRISSTLPVVTGLANATAITIHDRPAVQTITGAGDANTATTYPYTLPSFTGSTYAWLAPAATITQSGNNAGFIWNIAAQPQTIKVIETNQYGCIGDTSLKNINVYDLKIDNVTASSLTPCPSGSVNITGNATGVYNAGNILTAQLSDAAGSFANPVNIGSIPSATIGLSQTVSISAILPYPLANGTGYQTRIISSSPVITGTGNGPGISINKPVLGADKSTTISCANGTADITALYTTAPFTSITYSVANPLAVVPGAYTLIVTNANGCRDTAAITVLDASTVTVPAAGSNEKLANRECTDAQGWTHYYNDNGTPTNYSDDIRLLSLKKNGNNIGTTGDGTFQVKVAATGGAGSSHGVNVASPLITINKTFNSMNRFWNITPTTQPVSPVGVRFYYNTQDFTDVNGDNSAIVNNTQLSMYKLLGGNPDPTVNWLGATAVTYYSSGATPSLTSWVYTALDNNRHQAEFLVNSFSGGGAGAATLSVLPVTYISFSAAVQNDKVALQWTTATEINSSTFSVQRSLDGIHFETLGTVPAAGNSNVIRNYRYDDTKGTALKGAVLFYKIAETDINGTILYTEIKSVRIAAGKNILTLVYNPVKNEAVLNYECLQNDEVLIKVADNLGRLVISKQATVIKGLNQIKLQTANLTRGIYEVELISKKDKANVRMMKD